MAVGIFINCENSLKNKAQYVFEHIFKVLGVPCQLISGDNLEKAEYDICIYYGSKPLPAKAGGSSRRCQINIHCCVSNDDISSWQSKLPPLDYTYQEEVDKVPVFYNQVHFDAPNATVLFRYASNGAAAIQAREAGSEQFIDVGFDIIMSGFFLLSQMEDNLSSERDNHARFMASHSLAFKNGFLHRPVFDEYVKIIRMLLDMGWAWLGENTEKTPLWPDNREFAVCLTHDVDELKKYYLKRVLSKCLQSAKLMSKARFRESTEVMLGVIKSAAPGMGRRIKYGEIDLSGIMKIMELEGSYNFKSSFYFSGSRECGNGIDYTIEDNSVKNIIRYVDENNREIGMHGTYGSYNDQGLLLNEKKALEAVIKKDVKGIRQHFLRFDSTQTWKVQSAIGLKYDVTLGYADMIGFRAGTSFPFYTYSLTEDKKLPVIEIPLTIMDTTLYTYMKDTPQQAWLHIRNIIDIIKMYHGVCVFLWHPTFLDEDIYPGWLEVYTRLLDYFSQQNAWVTSGADITEWWASRKTQV